MEFIKKFLARIGLTKKLIPICIVFINVNFAWTFVMPYFTLQVRSLGLSLHDVSVMYGIMPFLVFLANPVTGYIGDKIGYKTVLITCNMGAVLAGVLINLVPALGTLQPEAYVSANCLGAGGMVTKDCLAWLGAYNAANSSCEDLLLGHHVTKIVCGDDELAVNISLVIGDLLNTTDGVCEQGWTADYCTASLKWSESLNETKLCTLEMSDGVGTFSFGSYQLSFWTYAVVRVCLIVFMMTFFNLADSTAVILAKREKSDFSVMAFFGTVASFPPPLIAGILIDNVKVLPDKEDCLTGLFEPDSNYIVALIGYCVIFFLNAIFCFFFIDVEVEKPEKKLSFREEMSWLLRPAALGFTAFNIFIGVFWGTLDTNLPIYLSEDLKASATLIGYVTSVGMFSGVIGIPASPFTIKKLGAVNTIVISTVAYGVRFFFYSFASVDPPWDFLAYATLDIFTFFIGWLACIHYSTVLAPKHLTATSLGVTSTCQFIIGKGIGSYLSGQLADRAGMRTMWRVMGATACVTSLIYWLAYILWLRSTEEEHRKATKEDNNDEEVPSYKSCSNDAPGSTTTEM